MGCSGYYYNDDSLKEAKKYIKYKIENDLVISRHNPKDYEVIETILNRVDYYQEKAEKYRFLFHNDVIPKKRIIDRIKELNNKISKLQKENNYSTIDEILFNHEKNSLQELLEEKENE